MKDRIFAEGAASRLSALFVLLIYCLLAFCALAAPMFALRINEKNDKNAETVRAERECYEYITKRLRSGDISGSVRVRNVMGTSALTFSELHGGVEYLTALYMWDGQMRELSYVNFESEITPEQGSAVMPVKYLRFTLLKAGLIQIEFNAGGGTSSMTCYLRSGGSPPQTAEQQAVEGGSRQ